MGKRTFHFQTVNQETSDQISSADDRVAGASMALRNVTVKSTGPDVDLTQKTPFSVFVYSQTTDGRECEPVHEAPKAALTSVTPNIHGNMYKLLFSGTLTSFTPLQQVSNGEVVTWPPVWSTLALILTNVFVWYNLQH